jgi:sulfur-oxidizing protein SoxX
MTRSIIRIGWVLAAVMGVFASMPLRVEAQSAPPAVAPTPGEIVAFDRTKGNCLACHTMRGGDVPSNVGPELVDMTARFPDRADLVAILNNEEARNPQTIMPPFGRNQILDAKEINQIIDFLYTL